MKLFLLKTLLLSIIIITLFVIGLSVPHTPQNKTTLYFSKIQKDSLLKYTPSPRIIFVGGSNLSFGLNSQTIKDSLLFSPINTAIHAKIGLEYMLNCTLPYVKKGDVVVLVPEYNQFYGSFMHGGKELLETVAVIDPFNIFKLSIDQIKITAKYLLNYSVKRCINFISYKFNNNNEVKVSDIYSTSSFNKYGDADGHWEMIKEKYDPYLEISTPFNSKVINKINEFNLEIENKEAKLYITYPGFQDISYDNSINEINKIENELKKTDLIILGTPLRYRMNDSLTFNTPYHLNKTGVDYRTELLIEDLKKMIIK